eukprot:5941737-Prymnesium_polylepis.1
MCIRDRCVCVCVCGGGGAGRGDAASSALYRRARASDRGDAMTPCHCAARRPRGGCDRGTAEGGLREKARRNSLLLYDASSRLTSPPIKPGSSVMERPSSCTRARAHVRAASTAPRATEPSPGAQPPARHSRNQPQK